MAKLTLNNLSRDETDASIIANLQRKGWVLVVDPIQPIYDPTLQMLTFDEATNQYSVINLSTEELQSRKNAQDSMDVAMLEYQQQKQIQDKIAAGYLVLPEGFTLKLEDFDRGLFTQMLSLVREALDLGLINNNALQVISDINGQEVTITALRFRQIMVGYGMYYKSLWDQLD